MLTKAEDMDVKGAFIKGNTEDGEVKTHRDTPRMGTPLQQQGGTQAKILSLRS